jgi:dTDP-4-amino-4,6-dideoxygalactose transaminase
MIPFSPPFIDKKIVKEVSNALLSGWITTGPRTKQFEKEIAEYVGVENVLAVNSWTAGAEMLLQWFGIKEGDEVIVPAYTYCATANIVFHCGAKPVLVDVDDNFCISLKAIENAITSRTKAIIPVDLGGLPVDYEGINKLINQKLIKDKFSPTNEIQKKLGRILFLSDAAHSFGATFKNQKVGGMADFTVFSFHAVKNLTTAEGGAICISLPAPFENESIYQELNTLTLHGQSKDALVKAQKGEWEYDVSSAGFKCNMTDILASIGLVEIKRYAKKTLPYRKRIFKQYSVAFNKIDWAITPVYKTSDIESSYHLYLLRIKGITLAQRNEIIQKIFDADVSVNVHYKPLPLLTFYKNEGYKMSDYPKSELLWEQEITLPVYMGLTEQQTETVISAVISAYNQVVNEKSI